MFVIKDTARTWKKSKHCKSVLKSLQTVDADLVPEIKFTYCFQNIFWNVCREVEFSIFLSFFILFIYIFLGGGQGVWLGAMNQFYIITLSYLSFCHYCFYKNMRLEPLITWSPIEDDIRRISHKLRFCSLLKTRSETNWQKQQ